jgi:hypothetical protein
LKPLKIGSLTEDRVKGRQRDLEMGSLGLECRHCGKDFFSSSDTRFSKTSITCNVMLQRAKTALKSLAKVYRHQIYTPRPDEFIAQRGSHDNIFCYYIEYLFLFL